MGMMYSVFRVPGESYSRELDQRVQMQEKPYGYDLPPPPADSGDYDMGLKETHRNVMYERGNYDV